jgi:hypothetical protein
MSSLLISIAMSVMTSTFPAPTHICNGGIITDNNYSEENIESYIQLFKIVKEDKLCIKRCGMKYNNYK